MKSDVFSRSGRDYIYIDNPLEIPRVELCSNDKTVTTLQGENHI